MAIKKKELYHHKATTQETLTCISLYPQWVKLLLGRNKKYDDFVVKLVENNFYEAEDQERTITSISKHLGFKATAITKWITQIYTDILILNSEKTELFQTVGIKHTFYFRNYDNWAYFTLWLPQSPRKYDSFDFYFIKAKTGTNKYWVKNVDHQYENGDYSVSVRLSGTFLNIYREQLLERALFDGVLHSDDIHYKFGKSDIEIDRKLRESYKL